MNNLLLATMAGFLIGLSQFFELLGFYFRAEGSLRGLSTVGYSVHVQVATVSRIGSLLALPILGYLLDSDAHTNTLVFSGVVCASTIVFFSSILVKFKSIENLLSVVFDFITIKINRLDLGDSKRTKDSESEIPQSYKIRLFVASTIAYSVMIVGMFATFGLAAIYHDYRATILQSAPILTMLGTAISVIYFDPLASMLIDGCYSKMKAVQLIILTRLAAAILALFFFIGWALVSSYV